MRLIIFTLLLTLSLLAKDKVALVIANKNYSNQTGLKNPIKDAQLIRDTLEGMGFEILKAYNKDLDDLGKKLDKFIIKARNAKIAVVYYAGHGIGVGSRNYLIPIGASNLSVDNLGRKLMSVDELKGAVANANGFGVVLFDACRNSFFSGTISGLSSGRASRALVQPTVTRANVLVSFSTQAGTKAEDDVNGGEHSPYAIALSENLKTNRDIRLVMGSIRTRVYGLTANQQYPIEKNMLDGKDYCLSGSCQKIDDNSDELARLKAENERLKQQQNAYVAPKVEVETRRVDSSTNNPNIVKIGNRMYQNQSFTKKYTWKKAGEYCQGLTLGGYNNWRLPTRDELFTIGNIKKFHRWKDYDTWDKWFDKNKHRRFKNSKGESHFIDKRFIENMPKYSYFWTSEEKDSSDAWDVRFNYGDDGWVGKSINDYALCVR